MENIEKVNHYTSIESLEKILESKKILFKRFDLMDDQTENEGVPEILKKNFFLSCWSKESKEMIPQWAMYAPEGIRIEFPINWYNKFKIPVEGRRDIASFSEILDENHPGRDTFFPIPLEDMFCGNYGISPPLNENNGFILEVEYCADYCSKKEQIWSYCTETKVTHLQNFYSLISYKDLYWDFQKEIRYYLTTTCKDGNHDYLPEHFFVPINPNALSEIKITLYPNCSKNDEERVIEICKKYLPNFDVAIHLKRSDIDGKYNSKKG